MAGKGPNTLSIQQLEQAAREDLGEDPQFVKDSVRILKDWINQSPHLANIKQDDEFLIGFIRGCKYSLERCKEKLDFFFTVRSNLPDWFDAWDPTQPDIMSILDAGVYLPLRGYDRHGRFVMLMRNGKSNPQTMRLETLFKVSTMIMELSMIGNLQVQVKGFVLIQDMEGMSAQHALQINPVIGKKAMTVWQDAYPTNPKAIHFLNMPGVMETVFTMMQSLQKQKMKRRNHVHKKNDYCKLIEDVGEDVLPKEYGGNSDTVLQLTEYWKKKAIDNKDWLIDQTQYKSDESKRAGKPKQHSDIFGIEGSFRKLEID